jgi:hypothetical protein
MRHDWHRLRGLVASLLIPMVFATPAPITIDNPTGVQIVARLPTGNATSVTGSVTIVTTPSDDHEGADVWVNMTGLPTAGGPFRE